MTFSDRMMKLAIAITPNGRKDWVAAMASEFAVLQSGQFNWALGCLLTSVGWRLQSGALYGITIGVAVVVTQLSLAPAFSEVWFGLLPHGHLTGLARLAFYILGWLPVVVTMLMFGFWRPDRVIMTATIALGFIVLTAYLFFHYAMHAQFGYIHYMDLPPVIGEIAVFGYCAGGAWAGSVARKGLKSRRQIC